MKLAFSLAALALGIVVAPAHAQNGNSPCAPREKMISLLSSKYSEAHTASGLANSSSLVEIWRSEDSATWTILLTRTNGISCIIASGQSWQDIETELAAAES